MDNSRYKPSLSHFLTIGGEKTFLYEIYIFFSFSFILFPIQIKENSYFFFLIFLSSHFHAIQAELLLICGEKIPKNWPTCRQFHQTRNSHSTLNVPHYHKTIIAHKHRSTMRFGVQPNKKGLRRVHLHTLPLCFPYQGPTCFPRTKHFSVTGNNN